MSTTTTITESSKSSTKPTFTSDMKNFLALAQKLFGKKEISDVSKIFDDNTDLEARIASLQKAKETEITSLRSTKDKEIAELKSAKAKLQSDNETLNLKKDTLMQEFLKKYKDWDIRTSKEKELGDEVAALEQRVKQENLRASVSEATLTDVQQQLLNCEIELQETNERLKRETEKLNKTQFELDGTWASLQSCQNTLQEERQELGLEEPDLENLATRFSAFVETSHGLARRFFLTELTETENLTWKKIFVELYQPDLVKIIPKKYALSNSIPSQYLRMAVAEKIIAMIYHSDIFRQYYLPESDEIEKILDQLYKEDPRREAIFRSQLRHAYKPEAEQSRVTSIVKSATDKVVGFLGPLLFAPNAEDNFRSEFERHLHEAVSLWGPVQRSNERGVVENEPDNTWVLYEEYDSMNLTADQELHVPDEPSAIMSLFPRVAIGKFQICPGYALSSDQSTVVAAGIESRSRNTMNGLAGNSIAGIPRRTRRFSSSGEDPPQSPRSSLGTLPALRHTHSRSISLPRRGEPIGTLGREQSALGGV